jgi:hypothetical protein
MQEIKPELRRRMVCGRTFGDHNGDYEVPIKLGGESLA